MVGINKQLLDYANAVEKLPKKKPKRKKGHASPDVTRHDSGVPMEAVTPDSAFGHPLTDQNTTKALVNAVKHLAGRHNQLDHGHRGSNSKRAIATNRKAVLQSKISDDEAKPVIKRVGDAAEAKERSKYNISQSTLAAPGSDEYYLSDTTRRDSAGISHEVKTGTLAELNKELDKRARSARTRAENGVKDSIHMLNSDIERGFYDDIPDGAAKDKAKILSVQETQVKELLDALKHLAGQHDQLDHGKRGGKGHWSTAAVNVINTIDRGGSIRHFSTTTLQHALDMKKDLLAGYYGPYSAPHNKATIAGKKRAQGHIDAIEAELKRRQPATNEGHMETAKPGSSNKAFTGFRHDWRGGDKPWHAIGDDGEILRDKKTGHYLRFADPSKGAEFLKKQGYEHIQPEPGGKASK